MPGSALTLSLSGARVMPVSTTLTQRKLAGSLTVLLSLLHHPGIRPLRLLPLFSPQTLLPIMAPAWILMLLLSFLHTLPEATAAPGHASPYTLYNYTWLIINEAGDVANSTSTLATTPSWTPLQVDLCALAMGASADWGLPSSFMPHDRPPSNYTPPPISAPRPQYGCQSPAHRDKINSLPLYVCPGPHRPRSRDHACGPRSDYFCASWGCETSGSVSWSPSPQGDYLTVSAPAFNDRARLCPVQPTNPACSCSLHPSVWCNPLILTFTPDARTADWTRSHEWGLRLYMSGRDQGLTFSLRLLKQLPYSSSPFALGPNLAQAPRPFPQPPTPPSPTPALPPSSFSPPPVTPPKGNHTHVSHVQGNSLPTVLPHQSP